ncbi:MAG: hypothetical protein MJ066_01435 [Clostridia bacterium]|nr:hypothetical protein [Clostridia bacterium]
MNITLPSFVIGPLLLACVFFICFVFVVGTKIIWIRFLARFFPKKLLRKKHKKYRRKPKIERSIEINPDEIDKIYVRKIS